MIIACTGFVTKQVGEKIITPVTKVKKLSEKPNLYKYIIKIAIIEKETNIEAKILTLRTFINKVKNPARKSEYLTWPQRFEKEYCKKAV